MHVHNGTSKLAEFFGPAQVGVWVPGGCDTGAHAARKFVENLGVDDVLVISPMRLTACTKTIC